MTKAQKLLQEKINPICEEHFANAYDEYRHNPIKGRQLYHCQAEYYNMDRYVLLKSYETFVACIDKDTLTCYDVSRREYPNHCTPSYYCRDGSATTTQQIVKFSRLFHAVNRETWYRID